MAGEWPFPATFRLPWRASSTFVRFCTQLGMKILLRTAQRVQAKNFKSLEKAILERPVGTPVVTVSNHASCIDDPAVWGLLPIRASLSQHTMRWIPAASELCFTNRIFSWFFSRGQLVPVLRGDGVYQRGVNYCISKLNQGDWIHVFPEGKVNMEGGILRLKWGVGRMVAEAEKTPVVIPLWHIGINDVLPNYSPYIPRLFKKLTVLVGEPIDFSSLIKAHCRSDLCTSAVVLRKQITDIIQNKLYELKNHAETLHASWTVNSPVAFRTLN